MPDGTPTPRTWKLQDAKARFSELVREARAHGPQAVTVHGREAVVVLSAEEYAKLAGPREKRPNLRDVLVNSPLRRLKFGRPGIRMKIRDVEL
ncbi:MAG: type II toxin-antitoxin system Phd/YefM family antitoxin [Acetobacteraceae bacterium]|nr:type II toxin-antitoxin system Phd/YefM family antitoxin [Acetobacteraceae bacterium]